MRFKIELEFKEPIITKEYRKVIMSLIKKSLTELADGRYFADYYQDTIQKDFCWKLRLSIQQFEKDNIILNNNKGVLTISTDDTKRTGYYLFSSFLNQKYKQFNMPNGNYLIIKNVSQVEQKLIMSEKVIIKLGEGNALCVREHNKETNKDRYYSIADGKIFTEKATELIKRQVIGAGFTKDIDNIKFTSIECEKVVISHYGCLIDATIGLIELEAKADILQYLYQNGIGSRRSQGLGYIDIIA